MEPRNFGAKFSNVLPMVGSILPDPQGLRYTNEGKIITLPSTLHKLPLLWSIYSPQKGWRWTDFKKFWNTGLKEPGIYWMKLFQTILSVIWWPSFVAFVVFTILYVISTTKKSNDTTTTMRAGRSNNNNNNNGGSNTSSSGGSQTEESVGGNLLGGFSLGLFMLSLVLTILLYFFNLLTYKGGEFWYR